MLKDEIKNKQPNVKRWNKKNHLEKTTRKYLELTRVNLLSLQPESWDWNKFIQCK